MYIYVYCTKNVHKRYFSISMYEKSLVMEYDYKIKEMKKWSVSSPNLKNVIVVVYCSY